MDPLSDDEFSKIYLTLRTPDPYGRRNALIFLIGAWMGLRASEILDIRIKQISVMPPKSNERLRIKPSQLKGGNKGKKNKEDMTPEEAAKEEKLEKRRNAVKGRDLIIPDELKEHIEDYLLWYREYYGGHGSNDLLFRSQKKTEEKEPKKLTYGAISDLLKDAAKQNGIHEKKIGSHTMRKTFASKTYKLNGGDMHKLQRSMGHKSITSTESYIKANQEEIDQSNISVARDFAKLVKKPPSKERNDGSME